MPAPKTAQARKMDAKQFAELQVKLRQKDEARFERWLAENFESLTLTNLKNPIEEIRVLVHLMDLSREQEGHTARLPFRDVSKILLRRLRALSDRCANDMGCWDHQTGPRAHTDLHELSDDDAPKC